MDEPYGVTAVRVRQQLQRVKTKGLQHVLTVLTVGNKSQKQTSRFLKMAQ
jgi:hypothetical protein